MWHNTIEKEGRFLEKENPNEVGPMERELTIV